jgi:hypothetical protein
MKRINGSQNKFEIRMFESNYPISNFIEQSSVDCINQVKAIVHLLETFFPILYFTISKCKGAIAFCFFLSVCLFVCIPQNILIAGSGCCSSPPVQDSVHGSQ